MVKLDSPRDGDTHTLADFAELLCLFSLDRTCSRDSIRDHIKDSGIERRIEDEHLSDCFDQIAWRSQAFDSAYPFRLDPSRRIIEADDNLSNDCTAYATLLICANLPFFDRKTYKDITETFETVARRSLEKIWFPNGIVKAFGKNQTEYSGEKWERMNLLAREIGAKGQCTTKSFRQGDSGDGGIDLIAYKELDAFERRHSPAALAQCACSRSDWSSKQSEISTSQLAQLISSPNRWLQLLFSPVCYRNNNGHWAYDEAGEIILFDRLRILNTLRSDLNLQSISMPQTFTDILSFKLDPW